MPRIGDSGESGAWAGVRFLTLGVGVYLLGLALYAVVRLRVVADLDLETTEGVHGVALDHGAIERVARIVTWLGSPVTLLLVVTAAGLALLRDARNRPVLVWLVATTVLGGVIETGIKLTIDRTRPDLETALISALGSSFPSGHAMNSTIVYGALALAAIWARQRRTLPELSELPRGGVALGKAGLVGLAAAAGVAVIVGVTRTLLGVHYLTDIASGWLLGVLWLIAARPKFARRATPEVGQRANLGPFPRRVR